MLKINIKHKLSFLIFAVVLCFYGIALGDSPASQQADSGGATDTGFFERIRNQIQARQLEKQTRAREFFNLAENYSELAQFDQALLALDEAIKTDPTFIPAHILKANILLRSDHWQDWTSAEQTVKNALKSDWNNIALHMLLATIYERQGARYNAASEYKKILRIDSSNVKAHYRLGLYYRDEMYFYETMLSAESPYIFFDGNMARYSSDDATAAVNQGSYESEMFNTTMSTPPGLDVMPGTGFYEQFLEERFNQIGVIRFENFGERLQKDAEKTFSSALELDSTHWQSLVQLGLLAYEQNDKEMLRTRLQQLGDYDQDIKELQLFSGLALYSLGSYNLAEQSFENAIELMTGDEYRIYATPQYLLPAEGPEAQNSSELARVASQIDARQYWLVRDPLFLSPENEREVAHYARCAYASFRFGFPPRNIEGLETDRGKVYVRYGEPLEIKRKRPEAAGHYYEFWYYANKTFGFDDPWGDGRTGYDLGTYYGIDFREVATEEFQADPEQYQLPVEENLWVMPYQIASFRGQHAETELKILYTLPVTASDLNSASDGYSGVYSRGVFLIDNQLERTVETVDSVGITLPSRPDSTQPEYFQDYTSVALTSGEYLFSLELQNQFSGNISMSRNILEIPSYNGDSLMISSILLASDISTTNNPPASHSQLTISPNPTRTFRPGEQLHLYYEIYNLSTPPNGSGTRFSVTTDIAILSRDTRGLGKIFNGVRKLFGIADRHGVSTQQEYFGQSDTERERSIIQIQNWEPGNYLLTVTIHDLNSDQQSEANTTFHVADESAEGSE